MAVVHKHRGQDTKEHRSLAAALVHDLGHGPFSHAFEKVGARLDLKLADHEEMSDVLIRTGEVAEVLNELGSGFANDVADIIRKNGTRAVEHAVVSSQFDADRLDYIQRDRMMTGTQHAAIDFTWLIANLEVGAVPSGVDETQTGTVDTFVLGPKAIYAAEAFVLGLFQLYPTVYFHKATRGAEKIFTELLVQVVSLVKNGSRAKTGLPANHPLIRFASKPDSLEAVLSLDDSVIWGAIPLMAEAKDELIRTFSVRLRDRKLFKSIDIRRRAAHEIDPLETGGDQELDRIDRCCAAIGKAIADSGLNRPDGPPRVLVDDEKRSPYKSIGESRGPLDRINIRTANGGLEDLKRRSPVVATLKTFKLFRAYVAEEDTDARNAVDAIFEAEIQKCRTPAQ